MLDQPPPSYTAKGFFGSLFDINFSSLIISRIIKVVYVIAIVLIGLEAIGFLIAGLASRSPGAIVIAIIVAPIVALFSLIWIRILLELVIIIFRIGEDVRRISLSHGINDASGRGPAASAAWTGSPVGQPYRATAPTDRGVAETGATSSAGVAPVAPETTPHAVIHVDPEAQDSTRAEATQMTKVPQAGWYPDPEHTGYLRYWDGQSWTTQRRSANPPS